MTKLSNVSASRLLSALSILIIALTLMGCQSLSVQEQVKPIQSNLLTKCLELTKHEGTTGAMVILTLTTWASEYNECAARHNSLVDAINGK